MKVLDEKYLLKRAAAGADPGGDHARSKQPYRAPEGHCFLAGSGHDYVEELLSPARIAADGIFNPSPSSGSWRSSAAGR